MSAFPLSLHLFGLLFAIGLKLLLVLLGKLISWWKVTSTTMFSVPFLASDIDSSFQSFSTAEIADSMMWKLFVMVDGAGTMETLTYNLGAVLIGFFVAILIWSLITKVPKFKNSKASKFKWFFVVIMATLLQPLILFLVSHIFNSEYGPLQFWMAAIFITVQNYSIYWKGFFLMFWVGWHSSNNLIFLVEKYGLGAVMSGFWSWFGLIFIGMIVLEIYYVANNWTQVKRDIAEWWNS
jgi:hypothetical protein